ncbi:MAG TPA: hypothetical protein VJM07_10560 [Gaiella sp.]|nr:hypothetical protein [Gaiella sp.]
MRMMLKKSIATLTASMALLFVCVPVAAADDPNQTQYGNPATSLPNETKTPDQGAIKTTPAVAQGAAPAQGAVNTAPAVAQGAVPVQGTLPFTGLDIGIALAVGFAVVAGGLGLRRLGRVES